MVCDYDRLPALSLNWPEASNWVSQGWLSTYSIISNSPGDCEDDPTPTCGGQAGVTILVDPTNSYWGSNPVTLTVLDGTFSQVFSQTSSSSQIQYSETLASDSNIPCGQAGATRRIFNISVLPVSGIPDVGGGIWFGCTPCSDG